MTLDADPPAPSLALWALNLAQPLDGLDAWAAMVDRRMAAAAAEGADMLVMPEWAAEQWIGFAPPDLDPADEVAWMAGHAEAALAAVADLPRRHGLSLLAGTLPVRVDPAEAGGDGPPYRNRAHLLTPDGATIRQDKLCLTPSERDPAGWHVGTGDTVRLIRWNGLTVAILVCLDIELPALAARLAAAPIDLILVPSMTSRLSGYSRVFGCARARAVELQAAVAAVGVIGAVPHARPRDGNVSGAAVYLPCEEALGHTGLHAALPPAATAEGDGPVLYAHDLPIAAIRTAKAGRAEVWPGAWTAEHVRVVA